MTVIRRNGIRARVSARELQLCRMVGKHLRFETDKQIWFDRNTRWPRRTTPDLMFRNYRIAVFHDGCYWHECPDHHPTSFGGVARAKMLRDNALLVERDWTVLRIWEHDPDLQGFADLVVATARERLHALRAKRNPQAT